ncbi:hypothetical protein ACFVT2_21840 [Streptomyces sp. NPDC058000]|uniref:hypothetical protein n=1 Tax=Streptomyces sp. NPDC058000 TaxID=3346299 RepID=UPI0036EEBC7D
MEHQEEKGSFDVAPLLGGLFFVLLGTVASVLVGAFAYTLACEDPGSGEVLGISAVCGGTVAFGSVGVLRGLRVPDAMATVGALTIGVLWTLVLTATLWPRVR